MKKRVFAVMAAGVMLGTAVNAQEAVRIGVIQPLTGSVAYNGEAFVAGARLAVAQRNGQGGVLEQPVELVIEDGQCRPANSVNAAEKLIQRDKVAALTGAFCSSATAAVMPVAEKYGVPLLSGVSSKADLTEQGMKWFFRSAETDRLMSRTFSKLLVDKLQLKTVAYIGVNDDWGRGGVEDFSRDLEAQGVKTVYKDYFDHGATDFYTVLTKLRALKPDGVFVAAETQDGSVLVKQFKEFGLDTRIFGVGSWATADFIGLTGDASEGIYAAVPYASSMPGEANEAFVALYEQTYKRKPGKYDAAGYNALNILMEAVQRAGGTEHGAVRDALAATEYHAPNGTYRFSDKGEGYGFDMVLVQLRDGAPVVVAQQATEQPLNARRGATLPRLAQDEGGEMDLLPQFLVNGLVTGSFYALSALGLTLILGLMRVVNFAHGELYMLGGVLGWWVTSSLGLDFFTGLALVALIMGALGWLVDRYLIERIRGQGEEAGILLTIGLSIFLANGALLAVGTAPLKVVGPVGNVPVFLGPVVVTELRLVAVVTSAVLMLAAWMLIHHTRLGRAMRATFQDPMAAQLAGIRTPSVYACTFALGTVIAALAGMLLGSIYAAQVSIGGLVSMKAFVVVILGGMGSFAGAIVGGLLLGVAEALWGGYVSTGMVDIIGFAIVILVLVFRPYGLFSKRAERA